MAYEFIDVDRDVLKVIAQKNLTIQENNIDVRLRMYLSTPEEMFAKAQIPGVAIEPGYILTTPKGYQKDASIEYVVNEDDDRMIDERATLVVDVRYGYKIGFYCFDTENMNNLIQKFLFIFPTKFYLDVVDKYQEKFRLDFKRDDEFIPMNKLIDNRMVYRRDIVVETQLLFERVYLESSMRPYIGLRIEEDNSIIEEPN